MTRTHARAHTHPVGLLQTSDQPEAETSTCPHIIRETYIHPAGFEPAIPESQRPQTHAFYRAITGIGVCGNLLYINAEV